MNGIARCHSLRNVSIREILKEANLSKTHLESFFIASEGLLVDDAGSPRSFVGRQCVNVEAIALTKKQEKIINTYFSCSERYWILRNFADLNGGTLSLCRFSSSSVSWSDPLVGFACFYTCFSSPEYFYFDRGL